MDLLIGWEAREEQDRVIRLAVAKFIASAFEVRARLLREND